MYRVFGARQPPEIKQHTVCRAGLHQRTQVRVVVQNRTSHRAESGILQPLVGVGNRLRLNVQPQNPPGAARQAAQEQRVVSVAAGGIQIQPARHQPHLQKVVAKLHRRKVRHAPPHQLVPGGYKAELTRQRQTRFAVGQRGGEQAGGLGIQPAAAAQNFLDQIAAVAPPAPRGGNFQRGKNAVLHGGGADDLALFI